MNHILLFLSFSLTQNLCSPLKFTPSVLMSQEVLNIKSATCPVDQPNAQNNCSLLFGPTNSIVLPTEGKIVHTYDITVPKITTFQINAKNLGNCNSFHTKIYYSYDAIIFDGIITTKNVTELFCSQGRDKIRIILHLNLSLPRVDNIQYPKLGDVKRIGGQPYFQCFFSKYNYRHVVYQKIGTNITREFNEKLTPGLWKCTYKNDSAMFDYREGAIVDPTLTDCVVTFGGSCEFSSSVRAWETNSTVSNIYWTHNGKKLSQWNEYKFIRINNITESASVQAFSDITSVDYNGTVASSARIFVIARPSLSNYTVTTDSNKTFVFLCSVDVPSALAGQSQLNFFRDDKLIVSSQIYELSVQQENIKRNLKVHFAGTNQSKEIGGFYHCVIEGSFFKAIKSDKYFLGYPSAKTSVAMKVMIGFIVILIILIISLVLYLICKNRERTYPLRYLEEKMGIFTPHMNFVEFEGERRPILRCDESCASEDDEMQIYN